MFKLKAIFTDPNNFYFLPLGHMHLSIHTNTQTFTCTHNLKKKKGNLFKSEKFNYKMKQKPLNLNLC